MSARPTPRNSRRAGARALVALVVALLSGFLAVALITRAVRHKPNSATAIPMKKVVVAKGELAMAATLRDEDLKIVEWPANVTPEGTVDDPKKLVGRVLKAGVLPGDPIVEARLATGTGGSGLAALIPPNMRAMTVKVNEASGVAGFIHPGDLVDVIVTMPPEERSSAPRSHIVLQNIRVLAVGQEITPGGAKPIQVPVVTLLVGPAESERLALASHGELQLTMRSGVDTGEVPTPGISPPELFAGAPEPAPEAQPAQGTHGAARRRSVRDGKGATPPLAEVVEIIRGSQLEERKLKSARDGKVEVRK